MTIRVHNLQFRVVFKPIPLVNGVVAFISRVASVEFDEESAILESVRMQAQ